MDRGRGRMNKTIDYLSKVVIRIKRYAKNAKTVIL